MSIHFVALPISIIILWPIHLVPIHLITLPIHLVTLPIHLTPLIPTVPPIHLRHIILSIHLIPQHFVPILVMHAIVLTIFKLVWVSFVCLYRLSVALFMSLLILRVNHRIIIRSLRYVWFWGLAYRYLLQTLLVIWAKISSLRFFIAKREKLLILKFCLKLVFLLLSRIVSNFLFDNMPRLLFLLLIILISILWCLVCLFWRRDMS